MDHCLAVHILKVTAARQLILQHLKASSSREVTVAFYIQSDKESWQLTAF